MSGARRPRPLRRARARADASDARPRCRHPVALAVKELKQQLAMVPNGDSLEPVAAALDQLSALVSVKDKEELEQHLAGGRALWHSQGACCTGDEEAGISSPALQRARLPQEPACARHARAPGSAHARPCRHCPLRPLAPPPAVALKEEAVVVVVSCCQELMATSTELLAKSLQVRRLRPCRRLPPRARRYWPRTPTPAAPASRPPPPPRPPPGAAAADGHAGPARGAAQGVRLRAAAQAAARLQRRRRADCSGRCRRGGLHQGGGQQVQVGGGGGGSWAGLAGAAGLGARRDRPAQGR